MAFTTWASAFTDNVSTITAAFLNQIRVDVGRAVDGNAGGTYTPSATLAINGAGGGGLSSDNCTSLTMAASGSSTPAVIFTAASSGYYPAANGKKELAIFPSSSSILTRHYASNVTGEGYGQSWSINADWDESGRQFAKDVSAGVSSELVHVVYSDGAALYLRAYLTSGTPFAEAAWEQTVGIRSNELSGASAPVANNLYKNNIPKAWCRVSTDGAGNATYSSRFNFNTATVTSNDLVVVFHTSMTSTANYAAIVTVEDDTGVHYSVHVRGRGTDGFRVRLRDTANAQIALSTTQVTFNIVVLGLE